MSIFQLQLFQLKEIEHSRLTLLDCKLTRGKRSTSNDVTVTTVTTVTVTITVTTLLHIRF